MTDSSMLKFQYGQMLDQLILLQLHAEDPNCPCSLTGVKQGELGEYCEPKHLRAVVALARETISMDEDEARVEYLEGLVLDGTELLAKMESILCGKEVELGEYATWARDKRKPLEELCYSSFCEIASSTELAEYIRDDEIIRLFDEPRWCFGVKEVNKNLGRLAKDLGMARSKTMGLKKKLEMPISICKGQAEMFVSPIAVLDPYGSRCRDPETGQWLPSEECGFEPAGITTSALGMDGLARYDFEFRVVSLDKLIVSHNPFTFVPNPEYPKELQPRLRERAATKIQVEKIAANLEPDAVLTDFHTLDRGAPIIGSDWVVEAGNGRVMGIIKAVKDFPSKYDEYRDRLKERAADFGLRIKDVDAISNPILVRVRITDVDRAAFTQEANSAATIAPSAIENARVDAQKITTGMLQELVVGENQSLEDALRSPRNQAFANRFLKTLPENVQASLVDAHGYLNRDGVHRMAMAVFVSAFQGDTGLRLAEKAFESIDMDVRNAISSIARSLGLLAQAEALIRSGDRDTKLSIGDDLAQVVTVYSAIKRTPELTVEKYLAQGQLLERELTDFEEKVLVVFEKYRRSPKKLGAILSAYAQKVIESPPPAQATLLPGAVITKEQLWESAVKAGEAQPMLVEGEAMMKELEDYLKEAELEAMKLLTKKIRGKLPPLYSQEKVQDPIVQVKFFTPDSNWTWYGIEFDGKDLFFGWVVGLEKEMGYFSLKELESARGPLGLAIERDKWFTPLRLSEVKKLHQDEEAEMSEGIGQAVITGLGLGIGFKAIDELAKFVGKREAEMTELEPCKEINRMLKEQPWGAESMLAWAERLKVLADRAEGCKSLQGAAYEKAFEVIKVAQPMLKPAKVKEDAEMQGGNETSSAGFPLDPRHEKPEDVDRFYAWTDKASTDEVLGELCERADYLGAHLCLAKEGDEVDREWIGKCPYIGTDDVYSELGRLRFLCWKLTQKLPSSVMIIGGKEAAVTDKAIRTKFMETAKDAVESALAKLDKVVKVGWEEKLAGDERAMLDRLLGVWTGLTEDLRTIYLLMGIKLKLKEEAPYATQIPKDVVVFKTTIEKHYRPVGDFHKDSIRTVKPKSDILVTMGCLKRDKWDAKTATCSPNPTVLTTVVPNNKGYMDELKHLKLVHPEVKVKYRTKEAGVEPRVNEDRQEELVAIDRALENIEVVD